MAVTTDWMASTTEIDSKFWMPEARHQGVGRARGKDPSLPFPSFWWLPAVLGIPLPLFSLGLLLFCVQIPLL